MSSIRLSWIIHIFALLHAAVALGCRYAGVGDQLLLTVLTMALSLIICMKRGMKVEFTASIIIVVNILGFLLGNLGAHMLQPLIQSEYAVHALSTLITTEILGWCIVAMTNILGNKEDMKDSVKSSPYMKWLLLIAAAIFVLRLIIVVILSRSTLEQESIIELVRRVISNTFAMIILICVNILFIRSIATISKSISKSRIHLLHMCFMIMATLLETFLVGVEGTDFILLLFVSLIIQITIYCAVYMINYVITTRLEMQTEREKATKAQYRYLKLKRQVNPHFLFNSLNILDCLICEAKSEEASLYTHKLASIYRYMIKSEEEDIVSLREELVFVKLYIDLLMVRFPEGFEVEIDVPEEFLARFVPPCSIQLLIENVTKHNAVNVENPLVIKVEAKDGFVSVSNTVRPKVTTSPSTGLGQQYIRQLYMDLSGMSIDIQNTEDTYCVTLPLL